MVPKVALKVDTNHTPHDFGRSVELGVFGSRNVETDVATVHKLFPETSSKSIRDDGVEESVMVEIIDKEMVCNVACSARHFGWEDVYPFSEMFHVSLERIESFPSSIPAVE